MNIALESDFRDYYDHWFCQSHIVPDKTFKRHTRSGMDRIEMLHFLNDIGLNTPSHGYVSEMAKRQFIKLAKAHGEDFAKVLCDELSKLVVYTDIHAHAGEGKELLNILDAAKLYPNEYCSTYITHLSSGGNSYRYLRVGAREFWLHYSSKDDWRSNCGNTTIHLIDDGYEIAEPTGRFVKLPELPPLKDCKIHPSLFSIDFIIKDAKYLAVDFNIAPKIQGTGIEDVVPAKEIYEEIAKAITSN